MEVKTAQPVYIISDEEESEEDNNGLIDTRENESQSESQLDSDYFEKPTFTHRKSVSFDLSGDERGRSEHERSHTPESSSQYYDSEQEFSSKKLPRKGILRASSPSSSNASTMETKTTTLEKSLPIIPTVARIKEIESPVHYSRSPSPASKPSSARSRSRSPPPAQIIEKAPDMQEIEQENPFRAAFLDKTNKDDYTEMAKVISRSPNLLKTARQQFFSSKSSDNLKHEVVTKNENISKSVEKLNTGDRPKIKPPPPPKPKNIKKADILQNLALDTFQKTDMGQADFTVYEHDATANVIHEVGSRSTTPVPSTPTTNIPSPKLPVRILQRTISRPRESPPLPPINFATLPKKEETAVSPFSQVEYLEILPPPPPPPLLNVRPAEAHEENSTDKILLTEEEHRDLMLSENELRNQLKQNIYDETPPLPQRAISKHSVNEFSSSNDTLDSWPIMHKRNHLKITENFHNNNGLSLSTNFINSIANTNNAITNNMQPLQLDATAAAPFLATQIFPSAQILPVQYTHLPQLQQSYTNISNLSLGSYVLVPQAQFPIPNATSQQLTQQTLRQQQLVSDINKQSKATSTPLSPSYTTMQFPAFSEIRTPNPFNFPPLPPTPDEVETNNYQNTPLGVSNDTITSSTFSLNSSMNSLSRNTNPAAAYYETAEQIYSTIKEDAIYSNTSFFDSRRSSDTSLNRASLTSQTLPPPLPPKKPGGYMPAKYISQSQPDLDQVSNSNPIQQQKLKVVGKETTV